MPELVRLYILSIVLGFALATLFTAGLIWWDVAGIGHLILGSDVGPVAAAMLVVFNGIVFSAVQFAFKIMAMAEDDSSPTGGRKLHAFVPIPVTVPADAKARHGQTRRR